MPRTARLVLRNCPHHIVQRGHNREVVFAQPRDYRYYLETLSEWKERLGAKVYAYCLMTNHVHLVVDPGDDETNLGRLMKRLAGRQTRYVNALEGRTGTLWEGRFRSSPVDSDGYLLACCRYVELNPVRAGMVPGPEAYPWSSYRAKVGLEEADWLDLDPAYLVLGGVSQQRVERYARFVAGEVPTGEWDYIAESVRRGQPTGNARFVAAAEARLGRRIALRRPGRPRSGNADAGYDRSPARRGSRPKNKSVPV